MNRNTLKKSIFSLLLALALPSCQPFGTATVTNKSYLQTVCLQTPDSAENAPGTMAVTEIVDGEEINEYISVPCNNGKTLAENLEGLTPQSNVAKILPSTDSSKLTLELTPATSAALRVKNPVKRAAFLAVAKALDAAADNKFEADVKTDASGASSVQTTTTKLNTASQNATGKTSEVAESCKDCEVSASSADPNQPNNGGGSEDEKKKLQQAVDGSVLSLNWFKKDPQKKGVTDGSDAIVFVEPCQENNESDKTNFPKTQLVLDARNIDIVTKTADKPASLTILGKKIPCDNGKTITENINASPTPTQPNPSYTIKFINNDTDDLIGELQSSGEAKSAAFFAYSRKKDSAEKEIAGIKSFTFHAHHKESCRVSSDSNVKINNSNQVTCFVRGCLQFNVTA